MKTDDPVNSKRSRRLIGAGLLLAAIVAAAALVINLSGGGGPGAGDLPIFTVRRGPLTISVTEPGTIKAREQEIIKSEVQGQTTIIYLIPEGTLVKKGELLVQLDSSWLEDALVEQKIRVQNAEAAFIRASETLEVTRNQAASDISKSDLERRFAVEDLKQYLEGQYPQQLKEAGSKITLAQEELERATEKHAGSQRLFDERYISRTELSSDALAMNRARLEYELAVAALDLLERYTHARSKDEFESNIEQTRMALERAHRKAKADVVQAEADLKAKQAEFKQQQDKLSKTEMQISKTKMLAPMDGMAVYATSAKGSWRGNAEPLDEGQTVRERQELIYLPTADAMTAKINVHESSLDKVRLGLPVRITVDAVPDRVFTGRVSKIAPLPDAQSVWMNPDLKVYATLIDIDGKGEGLRTGMSCRAEVIINRYDDAVYVPVQAIMRVNGRTTAYRVNGRGVESIPVTIGLDNNRMVHVTGGLESGQEILLAPPLASAAVALESSGPEPGDAESGGTGAADPAVDAGPGRPAPRGAAKTETSARAGRQDPAPRSRDADGEQRPARRPGRGDLTPEQAEQMRKRLEGMTPEQREAALKMSARRPPGRQESGTTTEGGRP